MRIGFEEDIFRSTLFENLSSFVYASANFFLLLVRQCNNLLTRLRAAVVELFRALLTLNEQQVTSVILAVSVIITRHTTLVTYSNNII